MFGSLQQRLFALRQDVVRLLAKPSKDVASILDLQFLEERVLYNGTPFNGEPLSSVDPVELNPQQSPENLADPSPAANLGELTPIEGFEELSAIEAGLDGVGALLEQLAALDEALVSESQLGKSSQTEPASETIDASQPSTPPASWELIVIDGGLSDQQTLSSILEEGLADDRFFEVIVLDRLENGVETIAQFLGSSEHQYSAIHLVTHGSAGGLQLGGIWLTHSNLEGYADALQQWGEGLTEQADVLIYGCYVAEGQESQQWLAELAGLLQVDIQASTDLTGSSLRGGDWDLEFTLGQLETNQIFAAEWIDSTNWVLANNAPVLDTAASPTMGLVLEGATNPSGVTVASLIVDGSITDADGSAVEAIAIIGLNTSLGTWQYSLNGGTNWLTINAELINNQTNELALLLGPTAQLRLIPFGDLTGSVSDAITFRAWDQTSGSEGQYTVITSTGGASAFSTASDTAAITVTAINDAPTFLSGDGIVTTDFSAHYDIGWSVTVQPDGKVLVGGDANNGGYRSFALVRYNADGSLDSSFGTGGKVTTDFGVDNGDGTGYSVTVQADGKIVVGGYATIGSTNDFALVRYNANGSLDTSFGTGGKVTTDIGTHMDYGQSVTIQPDGKIVLAGAGSIGGENDFALVRYNANGTLDATFGTGGIVTTDIGTYDDWAASVTVQPDGKIVVGGYAASGGNGSFALVRYNADGSLDSSFGTGGKVTTDFGTGNDQGWSVTVQPDGKIVVGGFARIGSTDDFALVRYNANGTLDTSFGTGGRVTTAIGTGNDQGYSVTVQPDGKIVVGGFAGVGSTDDFALVRYNANGTLDTSFGTGGKVTTAIGTSDDQGYSVTVQPDGKIVLFGFASIGGTSDFALVRYNADGSLDTRFDLASTLGGSVSTTENGSPVVLDSNVCVFDAELSTTNFSGATLTLVRNGGTNSQDLFSATGTLGALIQGGNLVVGGTTIGTVTTNDGGSLVLTFNSSATNALVNSAMQQIAYANSSEAPPANVQIDWTFSDGNSSAQGTGGALTATGSVTVNITSVNDAPVAVNDSFTTTEDTAVTFDVRTNDSDVDNGSLSVTQINGTAISVGGSVAVTGGSVTLNANGTLTFTPTANYNGSPSFTYTLSDGSLTATATVNGTVTAVQDAPVLDAAASPTLGLVLEGATNPTGVTVASLVVDGSITDPDGSAVEAIAITGLNTSLGTWQYSLNGGTSWLTIDANLINNTTNELALLLGPTAQLRLVPFGDVNGSVNDAITFRAWDQTSGSEGQYAVISATGGSSAFSTSSDTAAITVTAVNDAPTFLRGDGKVTTDVGASNDVAYSVTLQPDGRIVVAGFSYNGSNYDFALTRYNADGTLDTSFGGGDGIVTTAIGTGADYASSVTLQPDGKIVIAGSSISTDEEFALVRYNVDGMLDSSFGGGDGIVTTDVGAGYDVAYSVTLQPDGKIVVAGNSYNGSNDDFALTRYNADGSLDTSFGGGGIVTTDIGTSTDSAKSVTVQADGKIVVGGYAMIGSNYDFALTRYNADGTLDTSFGGGDGIATTALGAGNDGANSLTLQPDGRIVVAGYSSNGSNYEFALTRYNADGSLDTSFGGGDGIVNTAVGAGFDVAYSVTLQSDGKIVVAGYSYNGSNVDFALTRYNADGSLDTSFGGGDGIVTTAVGADYDYAYSVTLQPDGKIVVAGSSWNGSNDDIALVRYNADGSLDTTFDRAATLGGSVSYIENGSPVVLDSDVRVFDVELSSSNLSGATLTLVRNGGANGQDQFSATGTLGTLTQGGNLTVGGTTIGTVTTNSSGSLVLTFNNSASNALVNSAMQQIAYANSSEAPPSSVQIDWTFSDGNSGTQGTGGALTATGNVLVNITSINDAPVAVNDTFTSSEDTAVTFDVRTNDSDVDSGSLSVTQINGTAISDGGSVAVTGGSVTLNANGTLTFTPTTNYNGSPSFTYTLSDGSLTATATVNGTVTAVQHAPVLDAAASPSMGLVLEGATNPSGVTVASLVVDGSITDADGAVVEAIAITGLNTSLGTWQYSLNGGTNWLSIDANLINNTTNELALLLGPTAQLRLIPFGDLNGSVSDAITFRAWDQTSGSEGQYAVISATGGSSAFSTSSDTASITATAINDAPTFLSGDGIVTTDFGTGDDQGRSVTVQPDGKVLVAGYARIGSTDDFALVRYNADGSLDTSFGTGGKVTTPVGTSIDYGYSVTIQPDGKIVVAGSALGSTLDFALVRYNTDGSLDTSFGTGGKVTTPVGTGTGYAYSVTIQPDGKIMVAGYILGSTADFALVRYNADGSLDTSFGTGGKVTAALGTSEDYCQSVTIQPDGKIVVAGSAEIGINEDFALVRYNVDGSLDTSFGTGGKVTTPVGTSTDTGYSVTIQPDGKIVVGGWAWNGSNNDFALVRYNANGTLDTSFGTGGRVTTGIGTGNDQGLSVTLQPDGKLVIGGYASNGSNHDFALVRYNANGTLDTSFGTGGRVTTAIGTGTDQGYSVTVQPDGKIVVAGFARIGSTDDFALVRYNADGSLDARFDLASTLGGSVSYTENGSPVVLDSNVQIFDVELSSTNYSGATLTLVRNGGANSQDLFSATGTLGAMTQGGNLTVGGTTIGTVTTNSGGTLVLTFNSSATNALVNSAMQQIAYAYASEAPPSSVQIDWTFSDGNSGTQGTGGALTATGNVLVNITSVNDTPVAVNDTFTSSEDTAVTFDVRTNDSDVDSGSLSVTQINSTAISDGGSVAVTGGSVTLNADGTLTFTPTANYNGSPSFTYTLSDGSLTATATVNGTVTAVQDAPVLDAAASPTMGLVLEGATNPTGVTIASLVVDGSITDADGSAVEAIAITGLNTSLGTWQYSLNGGTSWLTIDANLINNTTNELALLLGPTAQLRLIPFGDLNGIVSDAITFRAWDQSSGSEGQYAVISATGGSSAFSTSSDTASITATAINDAPTFLSGDGIVTTDFGTGDDQGRSVTVQPDGKVLVAGRATIGSTNDFALVRYNADGSLDTSFGTGGMVTTAIGTGSDTIRSVTLQPDGKIVVAGSSISTDEEFALVRYNANGTLDTSFGTGGKVTTAFGTSADQGRSVTVQPDGKIVVGGFALISGSYDFALVRYNADGSLDTSFGTGGKTMTAIGTGIDWLYSVTVQPDGKIVGSGWATIGSTDDFALVRYNANGTLDTSFGTGGRVTTNFDTGNDVGWSVTVQPDGKIVVGGYARIGSTDDFALARYNADGTLDTSFGTGGMVTTAIGTGTDQGNSVTVQPDGKIVVGGYATIGSTDDFALVRYNANGTLDTSFGTGGKVTTAIGTGTDQGYSVTVQPDGKIVVGGYARIGGTDDFALVRYNADGSLDTTFDRAATLGGSVSYTENGSPVVLDSDVRVFDVELSSSNLSGATLTLVRNGGANGQDQFSATGTLGTLTQGGNLTVGGTTIGTVTTNSSGSLVLTFNNSASNTLVNSAMQQIAYANSSEAPPANVQIDWTFSDGNSSAQGTGGALTATGNVMVNITAVNDAPVAVADTATAVEAGGVANGTAGANPTGNVLTNDTDVDAGDTKTVTGVAAGVIGSASTNVGSNVTGTYGTININSTGVYTYTVDNSNATVQALRSTGNTVTDTFTYTMRDTAGLTSTTQITVTIQGANDTPTAVADSAIAIEDGGANNGTAGSNPTGNVLTNDFDVDSVDTQTVTGVMAGTSGTPATGVASNIAGAYGSIQIASDGSYTYTVDNNNAAVQALRTLSDALVDVFTYSVTDSAGLTSTGQISVTINGSNDNPTAVNDIPTIVEAGGINNATGSSTQTGNVLANDTDIDANDTKTVSAVAFGSWSSVLGGVGSIMVSSYGTMTVNADGTFTYWLDNSLEAVEDLRTSSNTLQEVFTYTMQDAAGASSLARITIVITGGNDAPQAVTDTFTATESRGFSNAIPGTDPSGNVLSNDTDIDSNDTQTVVGVASGVVSSANTNVGTSISGSYGAITIAANGSMTYVVDQSNASVQGLRLASDSINDVFSYTMRDAGGLTSTTQVTILITGGNDAPTAVADQTVAVEAGGYGNTTPGVNPTGNLLANDIEPDFGDTISVIGIAFGQIDMISGSLGTNVSGTYGSIVVASNGTYTYTVDNNNATVQALRTSADQLTEIFTYTIQDAFGYVSTAQITVTIQGAKDASTAVADTLNAVEAGGVNNTTGGSNPTGNVLSNDTSIDTGDALTVTGIAIGNGIPQSGLVGTLITGTYGTFTIQSNGSCAYTIDNNNSIVQSLRTTNDTLSETFTYSMQDNTGLSSSALITVIIHGDNDKIIAVSDSANAVEAGGVNNSTAGLNPTGNVLTNDTDVDAGDTKTVVGVGAGNLVSVLGGVGSATLGQYGSVTIHADGSYTYTVNNNNASVQALRTSANTLNDIFTYQVEDTAEAGATAKLTVVISGANDVPTAISDVVLAQRSGANGFEGISPTGNVVYNDIEPDNGDTTSVTGIISGIVSQATGNVGSAVNGSYGAITLNANGSYTYNVDNDNAAVLALGTPAQWIQDTFTYTISDSSGLTSTTQIYVRIYGAGTNSFDSNTVYATEAGGYGNLTTGLDPSGDFTVDPTDVIIGAATGSTSITPPENLGRALTGHYGTIIIAADGTYAYTVNNSNSSVQTLRTLSHTVADIFSYTVEDSNSILTEWRLTVAIRGANDAPGAVGDTFTAIEAGGFDNTNPTGTDATGNVLTNDTDVDFGDTQTVIGVAAGVQSSTAGNLDSAVTGNYGSITVSEDGSIVYVVDNDNATVQALRTVSDTIQDVFSYTMRDSAGLNSTAQITILITGSNDAPTAVTDQLYAQEAGGYSNDAAGINPTGNVFANDLDPDSGETKTVVGVIDGTYSQISGNVSIAITGIYGAITIDADGTYVYTVDNNNVNVQYLLASSVPLVDIFTYSMQDTYGEVSTAQITVSIHGSNDAPIAVSDNLVAVEAGGLNNANPGSAPSGNLLSNDHAIDAGDSWSISAIGSGSGPQSAGLVGTLVTGTYGSILVDGNGTYQYSFNNNDPAIQALRTSSDVLVDSFSYTITDGSGLTSITQIYVSITGSNDTPIATSDNIIARESGGLNNGSAGINPTGNVLANDTDVDAGETKTVVGVAAGVLGSVLGGVGNNQVGVYGTLLLSADGSYTYTVDNTNSFVQALRTTSDTLTDIFTYRMHDTAGAASTTQITIVIQGANDAPIAQNNSVTATAAGGASFPNGINPSGNVLSNDSDVDAGDNRTVQGVAAGVVGSASGSVAANVTGSFGSLQINANGSYVYTVDNTNEQVKQLTSSGPRLSDVFTYTMTDAGGLQSTAQITVSIRGANDAPIAGSDTVSAIEAGGVDNATPGSNPTGNVLTNDTDPDSGDTMTVTGVTSGVVSMVNGSVNATVSGTYGTIVVQANGNYTYTVNNSNSAVQSLRTSSDRLDDIFSYTISDFPGRKSTAQITVTIQGVNDALVAVSDSATAIEAGGLNNATAGTNPTGNVLTNDTDVDAGDTKTVAGVAAGVVGSASTDVGSSVIGTYGSIVIAADGNYTYTVDNANSAVQALRTTSNTLTDVFTYTARDTAGALSTTQITVTIQGSNDTPIASNDSAIAGEAGGVANGTAGVNPTGNVLTNDTDIDSGDTKTVAGVASGSVPTGALNAGTSVTGTYGSVVINSDGSYTYTVNNSNAAVQALRTSSETLSEVFTYTMRDTAGATSNTQLSLTITGANDAPVAVTDLIVALEAGGLSNATPGTNPTGNVLTNDTDVDSGDSRTVTGVAAGVVASASTNVGSAVTGTYGTITITANGSLSYTVDNNNAAVQALRTTANTLNDIFTYTIQDTAGLTSTTQVTITIQGANDTPVAVNDTATAVEAGGVANGTAGTNPTGNVLTNDTDIDSAGNGETKTVTGVAAGSVASPTGSVGASVTGTFGSINIASNGTYTYTVDNSNATVQALRLSSQTLSETFTYRMSDAAGATSVATVSITIQGSNDTPVAVAEVITALEASGLNNATPGTNPNGNLLTNDTDVDAGDTLTVAGVAAGVVASASTNVGAAVTGSYGTIAIAADGSLSYTIDNNNAAVQALRTTANTINDIFTYTIRDTAGATATTQVTITIQGANDTPIAVTDSATAVEAGGTLNGTAGTNPTGNVATNDTDVDSGETKTVVGVVAGVAASAATGAGVSVAGTYGSVLINASGAYTYTVENNNAAVQALRTSSNTLLDVFTYQMQDTAGVSSVTQLSVTIQGSNDAPVAVADSATAVEAGGLNNGSAGTSPNGNVLTNDTDVDAGDTRTVAGVAAGVVASASTNAGASVAGAYGSIIIAADGSYTYTVDNNNSIVQALRTTANTINDVFTYTVRDTGGLTASTQVTITIQGANDAPIATVDTTIAVEAGGIANGTAGTNPSGNVLTNDIDVDAGDTKTVIGVVAGTSGSPVTGAGNVITGNYGTVVINANGSYTYTVDNTNAAVQALRTSSNTLLDVFTYQMQDTAGVSSVTQLSVTIQGSNDALVAVADSATAVEAGGVANGTAGTNPTGNVLTNDTDVDTGDTKTVNGVVSGAQATATGNVGLAVAGSYGSINIASDGSYIYTVNNSNAAVQALRTAANTLSDLFTYRIVDTGGLTSLATITVTIQGANDAPVGVNDTSTAIEAGGYGNSTIGSNATGNVLSNDTDVDSAANGETWTVSGVASGTVSNTVGNVGTVVTGSYGLIQIAADGTYTYVIDESNATVQALRLSSQTITDIFSYTLSDAGGLTSTSQLTITIQGANDKPVSNDDTNTAVEAGGLANGTAGVNPTGNVLTNDTDVDSVANGESKTVTGVAAGSQSSATEFVATSVAGLYGSVVINSDGSYTYTVDNSNAAVQALRFSEQTLNDTFTYTMSDTVGLTSKSRLTITIQGANDAPVANDDTNIAVEAGGVANGTSGTNPTGNVLTNDTDIDSPANGETKRVTGVASGAVPSPSGSVGTSVTGIYGSISIAADGSYSYTVDNSNAAVQGLRLNVQTLSETFTYAMADTVGASAVATVTITIQGANDAPHDATGFLIVAEGTDNGVLVGTVEGHDVDDGEVLTYSLVDDAGGRFAIDSSTGEVTVADGSLLDFFLNTTHDIIVRISDLSGANYEKVMTVIVTDVNQGPSANPDAGTAFEAGGTNNGVPGSNATGNVLTNDTDIDIGDTKTVRGVSAGVAPSAAGNVASTVLGAFGSITIAANGNYIYTINNNQLDVESLRTASNTLVDVFTYTIQDRSWETSTTQITITIQGANDTPLAVVDSIVAVEAGGVGNGTAGMNPTGNVLANDTDVDAQDTKTVIGVAVGSVGSTSTGAGASHVGSFGTINIDSSGVYTYAVNNNHAAVQSLRTSSDTLSDVFTYTMQDTAGLTSTTQITVTIQGANDAPHDLVGTLVIAENAMRGEVVGTVTRSDLDSGDGATYSLVDNAGGRFAIDSSTGVITVADYSLLDYEAATSHRIVVRVMDSAGDIYGEAFTVQVTDIDEFDVGSVIDANTEFNGVPENSAIGTTVGIIASASDSDGTTNTVTYSLSNSEGGRFAIDNITGVVTVANSSLLDFEANESHSIGVLASSVDGSVSEATFTIAVLQVNERPVALGERYQTDFASVVQITAAALLANDYDPDGGPMQVTVMSLPSKGVFQQGDNGVFLFKPESNFTGTVTLVYVVSDGVLTSDPQIVEIVVTQPATTVVAVPEDRPVPNSANANALNPVIGDFRMSGSEEPAVKRAEDVSVKQEASGELSAVTNGSHPDLRTERERDSKGENYSQSQSDISKDENIFGDGKLGIGKIEGRSLIDLDKGFVVDSSQLSLTQFIRPEERQELEREEQQFFFQSVTPFAFGTAIGTGISLQILATAQIGGSFLAQSGMFAPLDPLTVLEGSSKVKKSEEREDLMFEAFVKSNGGKK